MIDTFIPHMMKRMLSVLLVLLFGCETGGGGRQGSTLLVASYNLRFDIAKDEGDNAWEVRRDRVLRVIRKGAFDLIGFQEMTDTMFPYLRDRLPEFRFSKGRQGCGSKTIAYRPEKFDLVEDGEFAISTTPDDFERKEWGCSSVRFGQFALFRVKAGGRLVRVINVHPDWLQQESRTEGMKQVLLKRVREAEARGETVVLMGDMNDDPDVPRPKWARDSAAYPWGGSILAAKDALNDAYEISETTPTGPKNSAHGFKPVGTSRLDHIFLTRGVRVKSYRTHDDRSGGGYPSDHDAVSAEIDLNL